MITVRCTARGFYLCSSCGAGEIGGCPDHRFAKQELVDWSTQAATNPHDQRAVFTAPETLTGAPR